MSAPIKRFKPYYLTPQDDGEYVRYSDYATLEAQVQTLRDALAESVKLQSHYAELLNMHDGGERRLFKDSDEWIGRLIETGTLAATEPKGATKEEE